jgi:hypothetical protein
MLRTARPPLIRSRLASRVARYRVGRGMQASARGQGPVPGHARGRRRRAAVRVPLFRRGQIAVAVLTCDVRLLRQMYPGQQILRRVPDDTRLVVCEPTGDLPAAWNEVPEARCGVIRKEHGQLLPFAPSPAGRVGPGVCARWPIVPRTSGHLTLPRGPPSVDC